MRTTSSANVGAENKHTRTQFRHRCDASTNAIWQATLRRPNNSAAPFSVARRSATRCKPSLIAPCTNSSDRTERSEWTPSSRGEKKTSFRARRTFTAQRTTWRKKKTHSLKTVFLFLPRPRTGLSVYARRITRHRVVHASICVTKRSIPRGMTQHGGTRGEGARTSSPTGV